MPYKDPVQKRDYNRQWHQRNHEHSISSTKNWKAAHPGYRLKSLYGITGEDKERMWLEQGRRCMICHREMHLWGKGSACVDHNHTTGQVRGLVCHTCNRNIAALESPLLDATKGYLDAWSTY